MQTIKSSILLDTETTGLKKVDYLIEIGAYEIINDNLTGDQFHIYIRPRLIMEERIVHIHGINNNFMMIIIKMYT